MKTLICISCPTGCNITIDDAGAISGNACEKGEVFARSEMAAPVRFVSSTVMMRGGDIRLCPVKTDAPIPKELQMDAVRLLNELVVDAPLEEGYVIIKNILGTGANFVATRSVAAIKN